MPGIHYVVVPVVGRCTFTRRGCQAGHILVLCQKASQVAGVLGEGLRPFFSGARGSTSLMLGTNSYKDLQK